MYEGASRLDPPPPNSDFGQSWDLRKPNRFLWSRTPEELAVIVDAIDKQSCVKPFTTQ